MPSKSAKQAKFMRAAAHNPTFAAKVNIPQSVAREFVNADQAKKQSRTRLARAVMKRGAYC
jgi:hypothetical protein